MRLIGILKGKEYHPVEGIHNGVPYRIVKERNRFLLEQLSITIGVGLMSCPVGFFDDEWEGVYIWDTISEALKPNKD